MPKAPAKEKEKQTIELTDVGSVEDVLGSLEEAPPTTTPPPPPPRRVEPEEIIDDPDYDIELYELDPDVVGTDVIVNVRNSPFLITQPGKSDVRLREGDRVRGAYFRSLVVKEHIDGLALCYKQTADFLKKLDKARLERMNMDRNAWLKEAKERMRR